MDCFNTETLIVFDYDDTLFPTTFILDKLRNSNSFRQNEIEIKKEIFKFSESLYNLLNDYIGMYSTKNIYIITSSSKGWIQQSLLSFIHIGYFKNIYDLFFGESTVNKINIIYRNESKNSEKTKMYQFELLFNKHFGNKQHDHYTIVSIGDSITEFNDSKLVAQKYFKKKKSNSKYILHQIKLTSKPTIKVMIEQSHLLRKLCAQFIIYSVNNKSIVFDYRKQKMNWLYNVY